MDSVSPRQFYCAVCGATDKVLTYSDIHKFFWCYPCRCESVRNKTEFLTLGMQEIKADYFVYALIDPRDQSIRYIGMSHQPEKRLIDHTRDDKQSKQNRQKHAWCQELKQAGLEPTLKIIEKIKNTRTFAFTRETYWIRFYQKKGAPLLNIHPFPERKRTQYKRSA